LKKAHLVTGIIEINDISFSYRKPRTAVFTGLNLSIEAGRITCILGHNGAGKSTLLKLIYGLLQSQSGTIVIDRSHEVSYENIFLLSERFGVNQELSLKQNLEFRCHLLGKNSSRVLSSPLIGQFRLTDHMNKPTGKLSAGFFMRANFVAGLALGPSLIMLDEPTNSIDPATRELLLNMLIDQRNIGTTVVLVTHDLEFAYEVGDRLIVLDEGKIVVDDDAPRKVALQEFRDQYIKFTEQVEH